MLFAAVNSAGVFFFARGNGKEVHSRRRRGRYAEVLSIVGVKNFREIGEAYQDLETKYEAGLQTIKSLQLKMERTESDLQLGSVNNDAIPGIKPLQEGRL